MKKKNVLAIFVAVLLSATAGTQLAVPVGAATPQTVKTCALDSCGSLNCYGYWDLPNAN
jgi:hypothetical protein